jgi:AraC family transcriptional regulator
MSAEPKPTHELDIDGVAGAIAGIDIDWLYTSPSFGVTTWNCRHGRTGLSEEKIQFWHVISFLHYGAFVLHSEGHSEVVDRTTALLYNPGAPYRSTHPFGCIDYGSAMVVRREVLLDVMTQYDPAAQERPGALFPRPLGLGLSQAYLRHQLIVRGLTRGISPDPLALETSLLEIVGAVAKSCSPATGKRAATVESSRARRRYVHDAQLILQKRFRERFRLEDIARELYVSPFHLCRLFKEETGVAMHRYVNQLRLRASLEPLTEGADLTDLALSLGFSGHSHFTTCFHKEFGVSPSQVRRQASTALLADLKKSLP